MESFASWDAGIQTLKINVCNEKEVLIFNNHTDLIYKEESDQLQQTVVLPPPGHAVPFFLEKE